VVVGSRDAIFMVMEYVEHDLKYILELQQAKKVCARDAFACVVCVWCVSVRFVCSRFFVECTTS
jgi:hypothetical protein